MNLAGWKFLVLSPIFSVHWGLVNTKKSRPSWRERQNSNNRKKFPHFKKELFARYNKNYSQEMIKEKAEEMRRINETKQHSVRGYKMHFLRRKSKET